jgi:hypothetical protein
MADSELFKQVDFVVESVLALKDRRSGLLLIRHHLLKIRNKEADNAILNMLIDEYGSLTAARKTMDYRPSTDFHEAHTMLYQPGSGNTNPEYNNF